MKTFKLELEQKDKYTNEKLTRVIEIQTSTEQNAIALFSANKDFKDWKLNKTKEVKEKKRKIKD